MKIKLLLVLFLSLFLFNFAQASEEKKVVRVAISNQNFSSYDYKNIKLSSDEAIKIISISQNYLIEPTQAGDIIEIVINENNLYDIYINNTLKYSNLNSPLIFNSNSPLKILELNRKGTPATYKGMIEISNSKNQGFFNIINIIDMQNYLRGVVSNEMPVSFGLEALKAQSVAARNYANNAQISPNYDVVDSTASQVYYGANSYNDTADYAVFQTHGIYALFNEEPITALYFSTSPGITDDWDDVFGDGTNSGKHPYLKARYDYDEDELKSEKDVERFYSKKDNGFDINSPKFRWEFEFDRTELEEILHTTLQQQSKTGLVSPIYDGTIKIEGLKEIKAIKRTQSGKITELEIIAKTGEYKVKTQLAIRRILKKNNSMLPSANFFVETSRREEVLPDENKDDEGVIKFFNFSSEDKYPKSFKLIGGGFGHGVGMSQYGAFNLAKAGKKYSEILNHYYTNIKISTMPKTVTFNNYNLGQKTEFYFDNQTFEKAYLFINNQKGVNNFPFKINNFEFANTTHIANKKLIKINITEYLRNGINTIDFTPLTQDNSNKQLIYRVEFQ